MNENFYAVDNSWFLTEARNIVRIERDDYAENPRDIDNIGKMFVSDSSGIAKNETDFNSWDEILEHYGVERSGYDRSNLATDVRNLQAAAEKQGDVILPVSTYSHGGTSVFIGLPENHFDGRWDCSFEGLIIADKETIKKEYGQASDAMDRARAYMEGEIEDLDKYVHGEAFFFTEYDGKTGEELDSCGGFLGSDPNQNGISDQVGKIIEDLGEYEDIEDCMEDNQEKLGIRIDPPAPLSERIHLAEEERSEEMKAIGQQKNEIAI